LLNPFAHRYGFICSLLALSPIGPHYCCHHKGTIFPSSLPPARIRIGQGRRSRAAIAVDLDAIAPIDFTRRSVQVRQLSCKVPASAGRAVDLVSESPAGGPNSSTSHLNCRRSDRRGKSRWQPRAVASRIMGPERPSPTAFEAAAALAGRHATRDERTGWWWGRLSLQGANGPQQRQHVGSVFHSNLRSDFRQDLF